MSAPIGWAGPQPLPPPDSHLAAPPMAIEIMPPKVSSKSASALPPAAQALLEEQKREEIEWERALTESQRLESLKESDLRRQLASKRATPQPSSSRPLDPVAGDVVTDAAIPPSSWEKFQREGAIPKGSRSRGKKNRGKKDKKRKREEEPSVESVALDLRRSERELNEIERVVKKKREHVRQLNQQINDMPTSSPLSNLYAKPPAFKIRRIDNRGKSSTLKTSPLDPDGKARETDGVSVAREASPAVDVNIDPLGLDPALAPPEDDGGIIVEDADTLPADGSMEVDVGNDAANNNGPTSSAELGSFDLRRKLRPGAVRGRGRGKNRGRSPSPMSRAGASEPKRFGRGRGIRK